MVGPCSYRVLHHLLGFGADFLGGLLRGWGERLGRAERMCVVVVVQAIQQLWSFESSKIADISTCQQFSAVSRLRQLVLLRWRACRFAGVGGSFRSCVTFFSFELLCVVRCMLPMEPGPRFAPGPDGLGCWAFCLEDFW